MYARVLNAGSVGDVLFYAGRQMVHGAEVGQAGRACPEFGWLATLVCCWQERRPYSAFAKILPENFYPEHSAFVSSAV